MYYDNADNTGIKSKNKKMIAAVLVLACLFLAMRLFLVRFHTDPLTGFYDLKAHVLSGVFDYIVAAAVIIIFLSQFFMYKKGKSYEAVDTYVQGSQTLIFSSAFIAFLMLATAFSQGYDLYASYKELELPEGNMIKYFIDNNLFDFITVILSVPTAAYFFVTAAKQPEKSENVGEDLTVNANVIINKEESDGNSVENGEESEVLVKANSGSVYLILSFFPIAWTVFRLLECFFDMNSPINSPSRGYEISSLVALMLYFLSESRFLTQRFFTSKIMPLAYISIILLSLSAVPNLIFSSFWILEPSSLSIYYALEIAFILYISARIYAQMRYSSFYYYSIPEPTPPAAVDDEG